MQYTGRQESAGIAGFGQAARVRTHDVALPFVANDRAPETGFILQHVLFSGLAGAAGRAADRTTGRGDKRYSP